MNQYIRQNQYQKGFINTIVGAIAVIIIAGIAGYIIINKQPSLVDEGTSPTSTVCTQDAKLCPDGSYVNRTGPNCEFAPCGWSNPFKPSGPDTIQPYNPDEDRGGLYNYPNYPLTKIPTTSITVKYLVEHRSALDQKIVTVRGVVVGIPPQPPCVAAGTCELYVRPSIILADTKDANRNKDYDLIVFIGEDAEKDEYSVGKTVEIKMQITASKVAVYGNKVF